MQGNFFEYLNNLINEDKLPHAFLLVGNTNNNDLIYSIYEVFYNTNLVKIKDIENNPNIKVISSDNIIEKSQVMNLKEKFLTTTFDNTVRLYFIENVERLNLSAGNKILKFLEEPENNIIGFLITNDLNNVLPTIKSRCEIYFLTSNNEEIISREIIEESITLTNSLNNKEFNDNFNYIKTLLTYDRKDIITIVDTIFKNLSKKSINSENISDIIYYQKLEKNLKLLDNIIELLNKNANIELTLNKLCIEWWK